MDWMYTSDTTTTTTTVLGPFFGDHPGEPMPEENFWTLWCEGRLTEADTLYSIRTNQCPPLPSPHLYTPDTCWTKLNQIHICTDFRIQCTLLAPGKSCTDHYVYIICHKSEAVLTITSTVLSYRVTEYWRKQCSEVKAEVKPLHVRATEAFALRLLLVTALDKQVHT